MSVFHQVGTRAKKSLAVIEAKQMSLGRGPLKDFLSVSIKLSEEHMGGTGSTDILVPDDIET